MKSEYEFPSRAEYEKYLRAYFAGLAMQGLVTFHSPNLNNGRANAEIAVIYADCLIEELNKK